MEKSKNSGQKPVNGTTRRTFLKTAAAGAGIAGMTSAGVAPFAFVRKAMAADKELKVIQWSHFVPAYDKWFDGFVKEWGEKNGVKASVDHIPHLEIAARMAAEVSAGAGHDLFGVNGFGGAHLYAKSVVDLTKLMGELEK